MGVIAYQRVVLVVHILLLYSYSIGRCVRDHVQDDRLLRKRIARPHVGCWCLTAMRWRTRIWGSAVPPLSA